MIIPDSDRALKRAWFAKKQLRAITLTGLPVKTTQYQGFKIKVWRLDDQLSGGNIMSPPGMVVMCMQESGLSASIADYWMGPLERQVKIHALVTNPGDQEVNVGKFTDSDVSDFEVHPFRLEATASPQTIDYRTISLGTSYQDIWCQPNALSYKGEAYWSAATGLFFYDPNGNDIPDEPKYISEILFNFYSADGTQQTRTSAFIEAGILSTMYPARIHMGLTKLTEEDGTEYQRVGHMHTIAYQISGGEAVIGGWFSMNHQEVTYSWWNVSTIAQGVPSATLRSLMAEHACPLGNYQFAIDGGPVQQLHAMNAYYDVSLFPVAELHNFYNSNPAYEPYRLTLFKWQEDGSIYTISSSQFIGLLDSLSTVPIDLGGGNYDYEAAMYMLLQLFPRPNNNFRAPSDSVMFHDHLGNIYTWTRAYGAVRFSNSGLAAYTLHIPTIVTGNSGVRPDIAYAGNGHYTLIATKQGKLTAYGAGEESLDAADWVGVRGVFVGTPFAADSWIQLPDPPDGFRLRYVRPVAVEDDDGTPLSARFIGVAEQHEPLEGEDELPPYPFRACFIQYKRGGDTWYGQWQLMSPIPVNDVTWRDQFGVGIYGGGDLEDALRNHPDPPNTYPNMPDYPYDQYAAGMP